MKIETDRLIITEFSLDMAEDVHKNSLDEDNRRFVPDEVFETVDEARETIEFLMSQYGKFEGPLVHPVITKNNQKNIGYVQMVPTDEGIWEIGYHIAKAYTGNGYATEAVKAFMPVMADAIGIDEIIGICLSDNVASKHVLSKCGFETLFEGLGDYQGEEKNIYKSIWKK
ncbi:GNAT family N-acetyltransferase [uncultured Eubacterium sp.]|uniref:GNAT family N-acetyltransferase n=1 Tax=uncultured Eubacterium sp. TaxID=165185 RepID=UPI000E8D406D|nr:GNAT family N-acetyltransferase [uncultured Eubacterium sp.]HAV90532.1 hypothetical protein [Eubacterium sp.]